MAVGRKRPAAVLDGGLTGGHATTIPQGSDGKRRRIRIGSTEEYEATGILGAGSFGIVTKARHRATGKTVAIKSLRPTAADASELLHEARFLEACDGNPHVVRSHGFVRDPDTASLCLAMDYVGPSLHAFLLSSEMEPPPLTEAVVRGYMRQLLTGAQKMHQRGVVHRDIKPANILVGEGGRILKFCDLGLAMFLATEDETPYEEAGTVPYMAPEMLLGKPDYDARVDTWSLGCVMAEMLAGGGKRLFSFKADERRSRDVAKIGQLWEIFDMLGLPDETTWPDFASLPLAATFPRLSLARQHSRLGELFHEEVLSEDGFQVLQGLLECNPDKRLTAAAALQLPWFLPELDTLPLLPWKIVLPVITVPATSKKKNLQRIKTIPPATPKMKKVRRIRNVAPATPKRKEVPIPPAAPQKKNVLRIPLAMWKNAHLIDPCKC